MTKILVHLRRSAIPYVALLLVLAVGLGGGYALAASKTKSITVCADKKTGILHLKTHGRCSGARRALRGISKARRACRVSKVRRVRRGHLPRVRGRT